MVSGHVQVSSLEGLHISKNIACCSLNLSAVEQAWGTETFVQ